MKKKIISIALVVAMLAIAVIGGTLAYFTDTYQETNVIIIGDVEAELYESKYHRGANTSSYLYMEGQPYPTKDEDIIADYETYHSDYLANVTLKPFDLKSSHLVQSMFEECTVAKHAYVKNTGVNDCFVRVRYMIPEAIAQYLDIFYVNSQFITDTSDVATADARTLDNTDNKEPMITSIDKSGANFVVQGATLNDDGYYEAEFIFAERLEPGEMTQYGPVSKITMIPSVTEDIIEALNLTNRQFDILVEADIIQADGFYNALEAFAAFDAEQ